MNDTYSYFMKEFLISKFKIALVKYVISLYMKFPLTVHLEDRGIGDKAWCAPIYIYLHDVLGFV